MPLRAGTGAAMILITHDLGLVAESADRIAVMYGGRIVEQGDIETVFRDPRHPYTAGLLASRPRIDGRRTESFDSWAGPELWRAPRRVRVSSPCGLCGRATSHGIFAAFRADRRKPSRRMPLRRGDARLGQARCGVAIEPLPGGPASVASVTLRVETLNKELTFGRGEDGAPTALLPSPAVPSTSVRARRSVWSASSAAASPPSAG